MKTKTILFATFALAAGLYACNNKNDNLLNPGGEDNAQPTHLELSFSSSNPNPGTRSTGDNNATEVEAALNTVDVYIFNANTGLMVTYRELTASDFTQQPSGATNEDIWRANTSIGTTTGKKTVFVGVNLPRTFAGGLQNKSLAVFNDAVHSLTMDELVTGSGLAMFSSSVKTTELRPMGDPDYVNQNVLKIPVKRLVAKVTVEKAPNMTVNAPGDIGDLTFAINNVNKKFYLLPKLDGSDPNYQPNSWNPLEFVNAANTPGISGDGYIAVNAANSGVRDLNALYATENSSVNHWKEEITRVTVRTTFTPHVITRKNGANFEQVPNPNSTPETFWTVILPNGYQEFFLVESHATDYAAVNPGSFKSAPYINGYCYYDMFLNRDGKFGDTNVPNKKWDVFRNDYYRCRITRILAPGRPSENVVDPKTPPETVTDIIYDIHILFWNLIQDDYVLEP